MEKSFSYEECQKVMEIVSSRHSEDCIKMYQHVKYHKTLIVEVISLEEYTLNKLKQMGLRYYLFGNSNMIEIHLNKEA